MREAATADLEEIVRLERATVQAPHWPAETYRTILGGVESYAARRRIVVAVEIGAEAAGTESAGPLIGFAVGQATGVEAEIESVAVAEHRRRLGLARALCLDLIGWMTGLAVQTVRLEVRAGSAGALALYASLGFEDVGVRRGYYRDPLEDATLMRLSLTEV